MQGCHGRRKKIWKMEIFPGQGCHFQSGKFRKMVREFQNCPKKLLANRLMESLFPMDCKQFMFRNIHFLIFMALDFSLKIK